MLVGVLLPHEIPSSLVLGPYVFSRTRWLKSKLGYRELGQAFDQPDYVVGDMKNYTSRPSALPLLLALPSKFPWVVLLEISAEHLAITDLGI